jgi:RimJ/RimL family protein N-acetyltransferase
MQDVEISTDRLILKSIDENSNLENYLSWMKNPAQHPFIISARQDYDLDMLLTFIKSNNLSNDCVLLGIFHKPNLAHIGNLRFHSIDLVKRTAYIGVLIGDKNFRGKGIANEAICGSINWIHAALKITTVLLGVSPSNSAARRLYERIGFKYIHSKSNPGLQMRLRIGEMRTQ